MERLYRPNVAGMMVRQDGKLLICERSGQKGAWQFPQGGIDPGETALEAVRPGGVVSAILYSGQVIGTDEKQTVLEYLRALPLKSFTVLVCDFANWAETAPLPCIILKK